MDDRPTPFIGATRVPWLRPLAQALRGLALLVGVLAATDAGWTAQDATVSVVLLGFVAWRALPVSDRVRLRDAVGAEVAVTTAAVAVTAGWSSPWLLAQLVPLGLAALGISARRAAMVAVAAAAVTTLGTFGSWPNVSDLVLRLATLVMVVGFSSVARSVLAGAAEANEEALGRLEELWSVRTMLEGLHTRAAGTRTTFSVDEALATLRSSSTTLAAADVVALFALDGEDALRTLYAVGLPDRAVRLEELPDRVRPPRRDGLPVALAAGDRGVGAESRVGAYVWLPVEVSEPPHLLVIEFDESDATVEAALPELTRLAQPLAITVSNAAWFSRVRHLGVDEERQRIAARLHDQFAQSLAAVSLQLDVAARRHPDDAVLRELRGHVGDTLGGLRDTLVELRASVDEDRDLATLLGELMRRYADRHGVVVDLEVADDGERPAPAVEQQLLRTAQELLRHAVEDRDAIAVRVRYACTPTTIALAVADDGAPWPEAGTSGPPDLVRDRVEAIGAELTTVADDERGMVVVHVQLRRTGGAA